MYRLRGVERKARPNEVMVRHGEVKQQRDEVKIRGQRYQKDEFETKENNNAFGMQRFPVMRYSGMQIFIQSDTKIILLL